MGGIYWLASYPKSGNTWFRSFLRNLLADGTEPIDINTLPTGRIASNRAWLDGVLGFDTADLAPDEVERLRPWVYRWSLHDKDVVYCKIHDAYLHTVDGLPLVSDGGTLGAIYIIRNPLDIVASASSHWNFGLDETIDCMGSSNAALARSRSALLEQVCQSLLSWSDHVLSWVDAPALNCHVIRYEDMLAHPLPTFTGAVRFLQLPDEARRIEKAIRFCDFQVLSRQEEENGFRECPAHSVRFFRQGKSGGWRDTLSPKQIDRIITDHGKVMERFGYLDSKGEPR